MELGRQITDNVRLTGFFNSTSPTFTTPLSMPRVSVPVVFRPSATDANNHGVADSFALLLQDQIQLLPQLQLVVGVRYENFRRRLHKQPQRPALQCLRQHLVAAGRADLPAGRAALALRQLQQLLPAARR